MNIEADIRFRELIQLKYEPILSQPNKNNELNLPIISQLIHDFTT